jgi:O-methyltransferase involved in polyketide biosynthesis
VTNYLESHAVDETFRTCVKARKESRIIFTYVDRKVLTNPEAYPGTQRIAGVLQKAREKWTFGLDPAELAAYLAEKGLQLETDVSAEEYRSRYYGERSRGMKGYEFYRVAMARVTL